MNIRIYRDGVKRLLGLSQLFYIVKILKRFSMECLKRELLPVKHDIHFLKSSFPIIDNERKSMEAIPHASVVGSLMYAMLYVSSDIAYYKYYEQVLDES